MYILNPKVAADIFDNEYVIANLDTGLYYSVQGLAVSLISALPFESVADQINAFNIQFPSHTNEIKEDLAAIWKQLEDEEIVGYTSSSVTVNGVAAVALPSFTPSKLNRYADMQDLLMLDPIHDVDEDGWTAKKDA